jgi:L-ascorbate peroxidase
MIDDPNADADHLKMSSDRAVFTDETFRPFAENFRHSQDAFFESYSEAHKKLSEVGSKFEPEGVITL